MAIEEVENIVGRMIIDQGIETPKIIDGKFPYIILDDGRKIYLSKSQ